MLGRRTIWLIGSSIVYWAHRNASTRPGGPNLNLQYIGGSVTWYGKRGMMWEELSPVVEKTVASAPSPELSRYSAKIKRFGITFESRFY